MFQRLRQILVGWLSPTSKGKAAMGRRALGSIAVARLLSVRATIRTSTSGSLSVGYVLIDKINLHDYLYAAR